MDRVSARLARGVDRRSPSAHAPPWLRLAQAGRPLFPLAVDLLSRRELPRPTSESAFDQTGLLGRGGRSEAAPLDRSATGSDGDAPERT
ncbi:hypothetical protein [Streptomyces globisporus]|uniref:hypothetical protein n=1 Tax=Streptomyces globisporus TaxID=1908 RepID=UPI001F22BE64|nr:hypothetical protein [Streptomyces globisporus]